MDNKILTTDPYAKRKKTILACFVCFVGILAISSFLIFGKLLRDFLIFDANRIKADSELTALDLRINEQGLKFKTHQDYIDGQHEKGKLRLQLLNDSIAEREAQIKSQQNLVNEYKTLTEKIGLTKNTYQVGLDDLKTVIENTAMKNGVISALETEINILTSQKLSLQNDLTELIKTRSTTLVSKTKLSEEILVQEKIKATFLAEISVAQKAAVKISVDLASLKKEYQTIQNELKSVREITAEEKGAISGIKSEIIALKSQKSFIQNDLTELIKTRTASQLSITKLSDEIIVQEKIKASALTEASEAKKAASKASISLNSKNNKIESTQKTLSLLKKEAKKMENMCSTLSAQIILAKETINVKNDEKSELEKKLDELLGIQTELSATIGTLGERKRDTEVEVKALELSLVKVKERLQASYKDVKTSNTHN